MDKSKLFKEFLVCPECKKPIVSKEEIEVNSEKYEGSKYCTKCGKEIASTYKEALAVVTKCF